MPTQWRHAWLINVPMPMIGLNLLTTYTYIAPHSFDLDTRLVPDHAKFKFFPSLLFNVAGGIKFDYDQVVRFTHTIYKNYRQIAYHNWEHGFGVAHFAYCLLHRAPRMFSDLEVHDNIITCIYMYIHV